MESHAPHKPNDYVKLIKMDPRFLTKQGRQKHLGATRCARQAWLCGRLSMTKRGVLHSSSLGQHGHASLSPASRAPAPQPPAPSITHLHCHQAGDELSLCQPPRTNAGQEPNRERPSLWGVASASVHHLIRLSKIKVCWQAGGVGAHEHPAGEQHTNINLLGKMSGRQHGELNLPHVQHTDFYWRSSPFRLQI